MSRNLWNKATWVLLAVTVGVLDSSEPAGDPCSVADLDGDCDVDLADYSIFQVEFTGETSFNLGDDFWDVFYFRESEQRWINYAAWRFYLNGTMDVNALSDNNPDLLFYGFDGHTVTIAHQDNAYGNDPLSCPSGHITTVVTFSSSDQMYGGQICVEGGQQIQSLMVLRRF